MSDEEDYERIRAETDLMLSDLKEFAERSKTDPQTREKFNELAPDWIILLITEVERWRNVVQSLTRSVDDYKQASEAWRETSNEVGRRLTTVYEELQRGRDFTELYDEHLRELLSRQDDDDDGGLVN